MDEARLAAVVCGEMNMTRCFAGSRIPMLVVCSSADEVTLYSRHSRHQRVVTSPRVDPEQTFQDLLAIGRRCANRPVLYYADDGMLLVISRNRQVLGRYFRFLMPDAELVEDLADKTRFAALAERHQLPVPATVTSDQIACADEALARLTLPCAVKPNSHVQWFNSPIVVQAGGSPQKALRAETPEQLRRLYDAMRRQGESFVIQEYIEGGDDCIYSFHAYYDRQSRPLAYYVGRKVRTYPKGAGISTCLELADAPEVVDLGLRALGKLGFVGPVKIDFKKDIRRNRFCMLEVNPRFSLWNYLGAVCGINIPRLAHMDLQGLHPDPPAGYRTGVRWLSFGNDLRTFIHSYRPDGDLTWGSWLWSLRGEKVYDVFTWNDPVPWIVSAGRYLQVLARRLGRRGRHKDAAARHAVMAPADPVEQPRTERRSASLSGGRAR